MDFQEWLKQLPTPEQTYSKRGLAAAAWGRQQAIIDRLMMEYCPDEVTEAQFNEWQKHQKQAK